jgi:hypothetical protein
MLAVVFVSVLFGGLDAYAQSVVVTDANAPAATNSDTAKYTLSGSVVNAVTGEPIKRALVQIAVNSEHSALTDSSGNFVFEGLPEGQAVVTARKPGFFNDQELAESGGPPVMTQIGPNAQPVVVRLTPESVIFGTVAAMDGEPIESMPVRVFAPRIVEGRKRWEQRGYTNTDDDGHFRVSGLPPGTYFVAAGPGEGIPRRRFRRNQVTDQGYPSYFYPGVAEITAAAPIAVAAGQQAEADFSLRAQPLFTVSGTVAGYPPGTGVGIQFKNKSGERLSVPVQFQSLSGEFQAKLPAGSYTVHATAYVPQQELQDTGNGQSLRATVPLVLTQNTAGLHIVLGPAISIPVNVRTESTSTKRSGPTSSARIVTGGTDDTRGAGIPQVAVRLSAEDGPLGILESWSSPIDPSRRGSPMALRDVEPGRYAVDVLPNSGRWYVQAASCGSTNLLRDELTVTAGAQLPPIEVVLRDDGGSLSGNVEAGGKPAPAAVLLVPERAGPALIKLANAGEGGEFQFGQVAPGNYRLLAFDSVDKLEYRNPQVLDDYLSSGTSVAVQGNDQVHAKVELIRLGG